MLQLKYNYFFCRDGYTVQVISFLMLIYLNWKSVTIYYNPAKQPVVYLRHREWV